MKKARTLLLVSFFLSILICNVKADEVSELKQQLAEQAKILQQLQKRLEQLEANQRNQDQQIAQQVLLAVEQKQIAALPDSVKWVEDLNVFGDLRYRHESVDITDSGLDKRNRNRIRARIGIKARVNEDWDAIFRFASGSSDTPISTNQTLGDSGSDSFSSKDFWLDWAYADWHPSDCAGFNLYMGKMKQPFYNVGKGELIWDGDVSPEGISARHKFKLDEFTEAVVTGGGFWLAERSGDADASLWGAQGYLKHKLENGSYVVGGLSYYDLGNVDDTNDIAGVTLNGNTAVAGTTLYRYDFDMVEAFGEYGFKCNQLPAAVFGNYVRNTAAPGGRNSAYMLGIKLNKVKKPGSWQFAYSYREVESDAVFGGLTDSSFIAGGTGGRGHELGFKYQLAKNVHASLTYFITERDNRSGSGTQDVSLLYTDLVFKF